MKKKCNSSLIVAGTGTGYHRTYLYPELNKILDVDESCIVIDCESRCDQLKEYSQKFADKGYKVAWLDFRDKTNIGPTAQELNGTKIFMCCILPEYDISGLNYYLDYLVSHLIPSIETSKGYINIFVCAGQKQLLCNDMLCKKIIKLAKSRKCHLSLRIQSAKYLSRYCDCTDKVLNAFYSISIIGD